MTDNSLHHLARLAGIMDDYTDSVGRHCVTPNETKASLLAAMGLGATEDDFAKTIADLETQAAARALPETLVVEAARNTDITLQNGKSGRWRLMQDGAFVANGRADDILSLPRLTAGYYDLVLEPDAGDEQSSFIIAAPPRAPRIDEITDRDKLWGVTGGLYQVRSSTNLGLGDYGDLATLCQILADKGADFFGINPIHALGYTEPGFSPYSPSHRRFLNVRHIDHDALPEFHHSDQARAFLNEQAETLRHLHDADFVEYAQAWALLRPVLEAAFQTLQTEPALAERREAFKAFRFTEGSLLEDLCRFEALSETHGPDWRLWPQDYRDPRSAAVTAFAEARANRVAFHAYLQFLAEEQVLSAQAAAQKAGMALGLYTDLAVGVRPGGAETWAEPNIFATNVSLGAPGDAFNPAGQCWGLSPLNPLGLAKQQFKPFISMIRRALRYAGMIRIDHILGFERCFWVPDGDAELPGAYVEYPRDILLAILRLEGTRAGALIIGEDLGLVPDGIRDALRNSAIYGCTILRFEEDDCGNFQDPATYRQETLASFASHDLPTVLGFWRGCDINVWKQLGTVDDLAEARMQEERRYDRQRLQRLTGLSTDGVDISASALCDGIHAALLNGAAALTALQMDDILEVADQPNLPGTVDEYPNWRRKFSVTLDTMAETKALDRLAALASETGFKRKTGDATPSDHDK